MKKIVLMLSVLAFVFSTAACGVKTSANGVPPGQMKKLTGQKSAKKYAPGQQKKKRKKKYKHL